MAKEVVGVRLDPGLLNRIDCLAEKTGETRSAVLERALRAGLGEYESWVESFNNPFIRDVVSRLLSSPKSLKVVAGILGEEVEADEADALAEKVKRLRRKAGANVPTGRVSRLKPEGI